MANPDPVFVRLAEPISDAHSDELRRVGANHAHSLDASILPPGDKIVGFYTDEKDAQTAWNAARALMKDLEGLDYVATMALMPDQPELYAQMFR